MAEKTNGNSRNIAIIIIAIVVVLVVAFGIFKIAKNNNWEDASKVDDIVISDKDSKEVKIEKTEKKIELINEEIEKIQEKIDPEAEKLNKLYEDYVAVMNEYQTGAPTAETE